MIPFLIICSADPLKKSPEIQVSSTSCGSLLDAKIGWHWEGFSSCRAWGGDSLVEVKDLFGRCGRDDTGILLSSSQRGFQAPYSLSQLQRPWKYTYNIWFKDILDHFCNICMSGNGRLNGLLVAFFICKIHISFNLSPVSQLFFVTSTSHHIIKNREYFEKGWEAIKLEC